MTAHSRDTCSIFVALSFAFALALSGCVAAPHPEPSFAAPLPTPAVTAVFTSAEQAFDAATETYAAFNRQAAALFSSADPDTHLIRTVASPVFADALISEARRTHDQGVRIVGENTFDSARLHSVDETTTAGLAVVVLYLCLDVSGSDILDASGASTVDRTRPGRSLYVITLDWQDPANPGALLVGSQTPAAGNVVCR